MIGGHATLVGHSFENGLLILKKVRIGKKAVIDLNAVVLPGAQIGDGATVAAGAVLVKNTVVEPGSLYAGVPAVLSNKKVDGPQDLDRMKHAQSF